MKHSVGDVWQVLDEWYVKTETSIIKCKNRGEALSKRKTRIEVKNVYEKRKYY